MLLNKNKNGFVLMEAIVVIVVITVSLITLFASYNKILTKVKKENKYDTSEYLYKTYYIREYLRTCGIANSGVYSLGGEKSNGSSDNLINYSGVTCNYDEVGSTFKNFGVKRIYLLTDINGDNTVKKLKNFDAYMIDYIRKLDVDDAATLIVVEYNKISRDSKYNPIKLYESDIYLEETYIASLGW